MDSIDKIPDLLMFMFFMSMVGMTLSVPIMFITMAYNLAKELF